jgi:hypothetical protein
MKKFPFIFCLVFTCLFGCYEEAPNDYSTIKRNFKDSFLLARDIDVTFFKTCKEFDNEIIIFHLLEPKEVSDSLGVYVYDKVYYFMITNMYLIRYSNYQKKEPLDDFSLGNTFCIFDSINQKLYIQDTIIFDNYYYQLYSTKDYLYFILEVQGDPYIYHYDYKEYISGIIIINKTNPIIVSMYNFSSKEILTVEQRNNNLKVVVEELEPKFSILGWIFNKLTPRQNIGEYKRTGRFLVYQFNKNLNLVSKNELTGEQRKAITH